MSNRRLIELLMINKCFAKLYYYGKYFRECMAHAYGRLNRHNHLLLLVFIFIFIFLFHYFHIFFLRIYLFVCLFVCRFSHLCSFFVCFLWWFFRCQHFSIYFLWLHHTANAYHYLFNAQRDARWKKIELPQNMGTQ